MPPLSELFELFSSYKADIEYEFGLQLYELYPLEYAQQDYSDKTQYKVIYSIGRA